MNALVAFGTRYGSTEAVANEIATVLRSNGIDTEVLDLRSRKNETVSSYQLVVVGSGIMAGSWSKESLRFLDKNRDEMKGRKIALFACCGDVEFKKEQAAEWKRKYVTEVGTKYGIEPISTALFGGVMDFEQYGFLVKAIMKNARKTIEERGADPSKPYDFRKWDEIREWAASLV
ncbi:MAG TPA: flavodoxin domain-containing protein [Methanomassiliicoccales archaeon]|jgi:menaquinone-dependent protoporphyrinogen oxidase